MTRTSLSIAALLAASCAAPSARSTLRAAPAAEPRPSAPPAASRSAPDTSQRPATSAPASPAGDPAQARGVVLRVDAAGSLTSDGRAVTPSSLEALVGAGAAGGAAEVRLVAAPEARWVTLRAAVSSVTRAGARAVALATERGDALAVLVGALPPSVLVQRATLAASGALQCDATEVTADAFAGRVRAGLSAPAGRANLVEIVPADEATVEHIRAAVEAARRGGADSVAVFTAPLRGLLSPEVIRRVVIEHLGGVNACHERGLARDPSAAGRVTIRFVIGSSGAVTGAQVALSNYPVAEVGECIARAAEQWRFPPPEGGGVVTVNYPFNLQPPED